MLANLRLDRFQVNSANILTTTKRDSESKLLRERNLCCNKSVLNPEEKSKLRELQINLEDLYLERTHGAFVRSRAK